MRGAERSTRTLVSLILAVPIVSGCGSNIRDLAAAAGTTAPVGTWSEGDCSDLADRSVEISVGQPVELLEVHDLRMAEDNRLNFRPPATGEALVLACTGRGVWSDTTTTFVRLEATVDSDGDLFIEYIGE